MGSRPSKKHSLDRINNNLGYCPGNVRWATMKEQNNNRRDNVIITHDGVTKPVAEWSNITGISINVIRQKTKRGMSLASIISSSRQVRR